MGIPETCEQNLNILLGADARRVIIDPDTSRAQKFQFDKNGQNGEPFEIYPVGPFRDTMEMANNQVNDGDDVFGGKNPLLAARPRGGKPAMGPGSPE